MSTGLSTTDSSVRSLSASTSSGLSTAASSINGLSTSTSSGLSTATSGISSLSTGLVGAISGIGSLSTGLSTTGSNVGSLSTAVNTIYNAGTKYFQANATAPGAVASGQEAVAIGPLSSASGDNALAVGKGANAAAHAAVAMGFGAKAIEANAIAVGTGALAAADSQAIGANARAGGGGAALGDGADAGGTPLSQAPNVSRGTAIGFNAVVQHTGGVALGSGSVASTAAGVAGYVPPGASAGQVAAVKATTSTLAAVSVGDAAKGQYRQITGVAAGTADSDATNVAQLRASASAVKAGSVQYAQNPDGSPDYSQVTLGNAQAPDGTRIGNVAPGVQGTDAVNMNQLAGAAMAGAAYTDARVNRVGQAVQNVAKRSYAGVASAMAMESAPYIAGKFTYSAAMGTYSGQSAIGVSVRKTAENGRWSVTGGVSAATAGTIGFRVGITGVWE
ncbi:Coiled stalk of trimeric autotransporter adhesin [Variovorax sp. OK605]|nr:Coiled stalk of trimeric autotransporter adhesin [Variovorax sp. OK605]